MSAFVHQYVSYEYMEFGISSTLVLCERYINFGPSLRKLHRKAPLVLRILKFILQSEALHSLEGWENSREDCVLKSDARYGGYKVSVDHLGHLVIQTMRIED